MTPRHDQIQTIFLDLDGVCCQWWESALKLFPTATAPADGLLSYWVSEHIGVHKSVVDDAVDQTGIDWWTNLPEYPWFNDLYNVLSSLGPKVVFLTSPGHFKHAPNGKLMWLRSRLGSTFNDFVFTQHKHLLANPSSVLIDDSPDMIRRFSEAGGQTVLFPQRWNENIKYSKNPLIYTMLEMRKLVPYYTAQS